MCEAYTRGCSCSPAAWLLAAAAGMGQPMHWGFYSCSGFTSDVPAEKVSPASQPAARSAQRALRYRMLCQPCTRLRHNLLQSDQQRAGRGGVGGGRHLRTRIQACLESRQRTCIQSHTLAVAAAAAACRPAGPTFNRSLQPGMHACVHITHYGCTRASLRLPSCLHVFGVCLFAA